MEQAYLVARRLVEHEAARDVAQETWLRWRREAAAPGEPWSEGRSRAWIRAVAQNAALSLLRKARAVELPEEHEAADPGAVDPARAAEQAEEERLRADVARALLRGLPPEARRLLALRELEGLSWEAIARVLGENPHTLRARHSRLRAGLRERARALGLEGGGRV